MNYILFVICAFGKPVPPSYVDTKSEFNTKYANFKSDSTHTFDVLLYKLDVYFPMNSRTLEGLCHIDAKSMENGLDSLSLDVNNLTIDSVKVNNSSANFSIIPDSEELRIKCGQTFNTGDSFGVDVFYKGSPTYGYYYYSDFPETTAYTVTEPWGSRYWFPCFDEPWDKADNGCEINITVPKGFVASSNGLLIGVDTSGNRVTYHWKETHPISTYLMAATASKFATFSDWYHPSSDSIESKYYIYRVDSAQAHIAFENVVDMMTFFSSKFGDYPFSKYGMVAVSHFGGGMEHQTMTTIARSWITDVEEQGIAHELAHMWWGDMITCSDWKNIWINEGFATYSEALYTEYKYGEQDFKDEMALNAYYYFHRDSTERFPIYNPKYLFDGGIVYRKASWVLHMLRYLTGDSLFYSILQNYYTAFKYGNASTEDFKNVSESTSGMELDWFFNEWIYGQGHPKYTWSWSYNTPNDTSYINLRIEQIQLNAPIFKMPIELTVETTGGTEVYTVWDSLISQDFVLKTTSTPLNITFDKDYRILAENLKVNIEESPKTEFKNYGLNISRNPFASETNISYTLPVDSKILLEIYDVTGQLVKTLVNKNEKQGRYNANWTAKGYPSGIYFIKLIAGNYRETKKLILVK
ncbi:MAG: M1 family aminopeptidase [bacterium]|nr:M1 family aminopeptidase [bacterium]